eukprot:468463_1
MPRKGRRGNNWSRSKKYVQTCPDRIPKKDRKKETDSKYYEKNKKLKIKLKLSSAPKRKSSNNKKLKIKLKLSSKRKALKPSPSTTAGISSEFQKMLFTKIHSLQSIIHNQSKRLSIMEKREQRSQKIIFGLQSDISRIILNENISDTENKADMDFVLPTTNHSQVRKLSIKKISTPKNSQYLGTINNLDPKFVKAYKAFVNLRIYLCILKNNKVLPEMLKIINNANKLLNGATKPIDLGSTSASTLSRLQQYRGLDLITIETCIVFRWLWDEADSVITIYHDGTSQINTSQESILSGFNVEEFGEYERLLDDQFTPETREGCIVRALWHQNIPKTDAETTVQWAVIPAFNRVDKIGYGLYGDAWIPMKERLKRKIGVMTDGNSTAQLTSSKIGNIYKTEIIMKNICLQHNYGNNITPGIERLKVLRMYFLQNDEIESNVVVRTVNMSILEICLNIQKVLVEGIDNIRSKGRLFKFLLGHGKSVSFGREIGDRKQHQFKSVEAAVSVRHILLRLSQFADTKGKPVLYNARVLYEFSKSNILLREALITINFGRVYSTPALLKTSKYDPLMKSCLPVVREMLDNLSDLFQVGFKSVKMLGLVLGLLSLNNDIPVNIIVNKIELQSNLEMLCDFGGIINDMSKKRMVDIDMFLHKVQLIINKSKRTFQDKYYHYLFASTPKEFELILEGIYGVYKVTFEDMTKRFNQQCMNPPKSMLGNNDGTESMQGSSKYYQKCKQRISELSRAVRTLHDVNKIWYTFDWIMKYDFDLFVDMLIFWYFHCGSYLSKEQEKQIRLLKYNKQKEQQCREIIDNSICMVPKVPAHLSSSCKKIKLKPPIPVNFDWIEHQAWHKWCIVRNKKIIEVVGLGVMLSREKLKNKILEIIKDEKLMKYSMKIKSSWGAKKLQDELYKHCKKYATPMINSNCPQINDVL